MSSRKPAPATGPSGTAFYDAECGFCTRLLARFGGPFRRAGFAFVPLQEVLRQGEPPLPEAEFRREMKLQLPDGRWLGAADAWLAMARQVWWLRPWAWVGGLPGCRSLVRVVYRWLAANRHRLGGQCTLARGTGSERTEPR